VTGAPLPDRRFLVPVIVGGLLALSVVAALLVWSAEKADAERENAALARQAAAAAERTVELTGASLRGAAGVLRRSGPMPERGFRRYARDIIASTPIRSLRWAPRVPARERRAFERTIGRTISEPRAATEHQPEGDFAPVEDRNGAYLPIRFVHPDERGPRRYLGLDLLSEPVRAEAVRVARDTGMVTITTPLFLTGRADPLVVVIDPVYAPGGMLTTRRDRRLALAGIIAAPISAEAILAEIEDTLGDDLAIGIRDGETELVAPTAAHDNGSTAEVDVLRRDWSVWVENTEEAEVLPALAVGATGFALAALVAALFALAGRREVLLSQERDLAARDAAAQRETASTLQQAFLPPTLPSVPGIDTSAMYAPGAEGLQVGGDFYDLFATDGVWTAMIGDVSGKGAQAASLTALVRHTARAVADRGPAAAVAGINEAVERETKPGTFATLCLANLDPSADGTELTIVVAGHPPPLLVRPGGVVEPIQPTSPLVGVEPHIEPREAHARLAPGEALFLYTDGLIEARRRGGKPLGEAGLRRTLAAIRSADPDELIGAALEAARAISADFPQDDVAMLALRSAP
jgi:serine phosphatase RsbU (regulator of sigma subunit)/CHASE1-domain containing sensor protein